MHSDETDGISEHLNGLAADGDSASRVAEAVGVTLADIERALTPIVGVRGVAALYKRALHLSTGTFAWMPAAPAGVPAAMDTGPLCTALAQRSAADAAAAGARLIREFRDLLSALIGPQLTERLLRSAWIHFLSGPTARDKTP
jgi:hypothetical protein